MDAIKAINSTNEDVDTPTDPQVNTVTTSPNDSTVQQLTNMIQELVQQQVNTLTDAEP